MQWVKKNKKWFLRVLFILMVPVVLLVLGIAYLNLSAFEMAYQPQTLKQYEESLGPQPALVRGKVVIKEVPTHVVSTELLVRLKSLAVSEDFTIEGVQVSPDLNQVYLNTRYHGVVLPLSLPLEPVVQDGCIYVDFDEVTITDKGITFQDTKAQNLLGKLFGDKLPIIIDVKEIVKPELAQLIQVEKIETGIELQFEVNTAWISEVMTAINNSANPEIKSVMKRSDSEAFQSALSLVERASGLSDEDYETIIRDVLEGGDIGKALLTLANHDVAKAVIEAVAPRLDAISLNDLMTAKKELLDGPLLAYSKAIFEAFETTYLTENVYYNLGQPYDILTHQYISVQDVAKGLNLGLSKEVEDVLEFRYDSGGSGLYIVYPFESGIYLMLGKEEDVMIDEASYDQYFFYEDTGIAKLVDDRQVYEDIEKALLSYFPTEQVFIRYMNADQKYAYVIASPVENYQNYWIFAMEKRTEGWNVLMEVDTLKHLNEVFPRFNISTALIEGEVTLYKVDETMMISILKDLKDKGKLAANSDLTIDYCSYGNEYIALMLSDGTQYMYKVTSNYLNTVYLKGKTPVTWENIPEIITLQDKPEE